MIAALVKASGRQGLSAFLPPEERVVQTSRHGADADTAVPHLPLVDNWQKGDFALESVMGNSHETSVRQYALQVLHRYRYVIGMCAPRSASLSSVSLTPSF